MMRHMTEGPGQQPPQEPRNPASDGRREVLEGRVIPSRASDPRRSFSAPPQGQNPQQQSGAEPGDRQQAQQWSQSAPQPGGQPQAQQPGGGPFTARPGTPGGPQGGQHGVPRQQQAPAQAPGGTPPRGQAANQAPGTPDWGALAEEQESGARKRRIMMLVGGIVAVAVIAGGVATAVVMSGGSSSDKPIADSSSGAGTASQSLPPAPSFSSVAPPPPANPLDFISTAAKDTAPLTSASLFPGTKFVINGRTYVQTNTATATDCSAAARGRLAGALSAHGCSKLVRATYTNGKTAVTIGIAVFPDKAHAAALRKVAQYVAPLNGGGIADFCHAVACQMTSNAVGRYAYFAIAGYKNGQTLPASDTVALRSANEASNFAFQRIIQRGRDAAQAAANKQ